MWRRDAVTETVSPGFGWMITTFGSVACHTTIKGSLLVIRLLHNLDSCNYCHDYFQTFPFPLSRNKITCICSDHVPLNICGLLADPASISTMITNNSSTNWEPSTLLLVAPFFYTLVKKKISASDCPTGPPPPHLRLVTDSRPAIPLPEEYGDRVEITLSCWELTSQKKILLEWCDWIGYNPSHPSPPNGANAVSSNSDVLVYFSNERKCFLPLHIYGVLNYLMIFRGIRC